MRPLLDACLLVVAVVSVGCDLGYISAGETDADVAVDAEVDADADDDGDEATDAGTDAEVSGDLCLDVVCANPGEACDPRDGTCVPGLADEDEDGHTVEEGDCDDGDPLVYPGAVEICDGIDQSCDGVVDEGFDADADGYTSCGSGDPARADCDDLDPFVHPGAEEVCDEDVDRDCDDMSRCTDIDCDESACGGGFTCRDGACRSMCDGETHQGFGCELCPAGVDDMCTPDYCYVFCVADSGCSASVRQPEMAEFVPYDEAICFDGFAETSTYWRLESAH